MAAPSSGSAAPLTGLGYIPGSLRTFAKRVARAFLDDVHICVFDIIVRHECVKETDIAELVQLGPKQTKNSLLILEKNRFVKRQMLPDPLRDPDKPARKLEYWYIDYRTLLNVVRYKLDKMRLSLEKQAEMARLQSTYECPSCGNSYTDLDHMEIMDFMTGEFRCPDCATTLESKVNANAAEESKNTIARFNKQMEPLFKALRSFDDMVLSDAILLPPANAENILWHRSAHMNQSRAKRPDGAYQTIRTSGLTTRSLMAEEQTINVDIVDDNYVAEEMKAQPKWIQPSTVLGASNAASAEGAAADQDPSASASSAQLSVALGAGEPAGVEILEEEEEEESESEEEEEEDDDMEDI